MADKHTQVHKRRADRQTHRNTYTFRQTEADRQTGQVLPDRQADRQAGGQTRQYKELDMHRQTRIQRHTD